MEPPVWHPTTLWGTCDITTTGRKSGLPRQIEIWYFVVDGTVYLTGTPGQRDWYANLLSRSKFIFHVKEGALLDLTARALPITDLSERRRIIAAIMRSSSWFHGQSYDLEAWVVGSPLIAVQFG